MCQACMQFKVFFSFAELEDVKKNKTGGESWKNNDFPICKTIVKVPAIVR